MPIRRIRADGLCAAFAFTLMTGCGSSEETKRIDALDEKVASIDKQVNDLAKRVQGIPQRQDLNDVKTSIQSLKTEVNKLQAILAAFLINRLPGERQEQWLARVKDKLDKLDKEQVPGGISVISAEVPCTAAVGGGVTLAVLSVKAVERVTWVYVELNATEDSDIKVDRQNMYITDSLAHRYPVKQFDQTHLDRSDRDLIKLHAGEKVRTYMVVRELDPKAKLFELYWPGCKVTTFTINRDEQ